MKSTWWIRLQVDLVDDHRAQMVNPRAFRTMINCWCVAARTDGQLPEPAELAWRLRMPVEHVLEDLQELEAAGLMEDARDGSSRPQGWEDKQPMTSAERQKRYRERMKGKAETEQAPESTPGDGERNGVTENVTETVTSDVTSDVTDSVTRDVTRDEGSNVTRDALDKIREENISLKTSPALRLVTVTNGPPPAMRHRTAKAEVEGWFNAFWAEYPRRVGRVDAKKAFRKAVTGEAEFAKVMAGLQAQLPALRAKDPEYIPYPATWIRGQRWTDEPATVQAAAKVEDDLPTVTGWDR